MGRRRGGGGTARHWHCGGARTRGGGPPGWAIVHTRTDHPAVETMCMYQRSTLSKREIILYKGIIENINIP